MNTMNTANYNWTESINRASEKPGEIQLGLNRFLCRPGHSPYLGVLALSDGVGDL